MNSSSKNLLHKFSFKLDDADDFLCIVSTSMDYGTVLLGVLIIQDVLLGLLMAILPRVAMTTQPSTAWIAVLILYVAMILKLLAGKVFFIKIFSLDIVLHYIFKQLNITDSVKAMNSYHLLTLTGVTVGRGFASWPGHTKDHHKNGTNCLPA